MKCKEDHDSMDYVECDDCGRKACRMCEGGWVTDFDEGVRRCGGCVYWKGKITEEKVGKNTHIS